MKQKFILHSKTIWSALLTLLVATMPNIQRAIETETITRFDLIEVLAILLTTGGTIASRYAARGEIYTPYGIPGCDSFLAKIG